MAQQPLQALVFSHLPFEDLGSLEPVLAQRGFSIRTVDVATAQFPLHETQTCDLLVVMGGPIGVYDSADYPFLTAEIDCLRQRLAANKPTLGICLGAQLIAAALGARVYPGAHGSEIGWFPIRAAGPESTPDWFLPLLAKDLRVLHWHGDTFDLPAGARHLASSDKYVNQAFAVGKTALALQFHPEVNALGLERWYIGHTCELHQKGIRVPDLRAATQTYAPQLLEAASRFWNLWLNYIL
jgi:GMP synthase (glutamine-hydrolysing)